MSFPHLQRGCGRLYVTNYAGSRITVFAQGATGNVAPLQTIEGSDTALYHPLGIWFAEWCPNDFASRKTSPH